jgi:DNA-binding NarL/FixJ family response regulator
MREPLDAPTPLRPQPPAAGLSLVADSAPPRDRTRSPAPLRVVVAHGEPLARAGLRALLETSGRAEFQVVATAASGEEAVAATRDLRPDVVVLDLKLPGPAGLRVMRRIRADAEARSTEVGVLLLMDVVSDGVVVDALRAGARGLLGPDAAPEELVEALCTLAAGRAALAPSVAGGLIDAVLARPERLDPRPDELAELTDREREIMALVGWGLSNHEIAHRLVISPATARTHVSRAMVKLHAQDRAQLVTLAYQCGLVTAGDPVGRRAAARQIAGHPTSAVAA